MGLADMFQVAWQREVPSDGVDIRHHEVRRGFKSLGSEKSLRTMARTPVTSESWGFQVAWQREVPSDTPVSGLPWFTRLAFQVAWQREVPSDGQAYQVTCRIASFKSLGSEKSLRTWWGDTPDDVAERVFQVAWQREVPSDVTHSPRRTTSRWFQVAWQREVPSDQKSPSDTVRPKVSSRLAARSPFGPRVRLRRHVDARMFQVAWQREVPSDHPVGRVRRATKQFQVAWQRDVRAAHSGAARRLGDAPVEALSARVGRSAPCTPDAPQVVRGNTQTALIGPPSRALAVQPRPGRCTPQIPSTGGIGGTGRASPDRDRGSQWPSP